MGGGKSTCRGQEMGKAGAFQAVKEGPVGQARRVEEPLAQDLDGKEGTHHAEQV